MVYMSAHDWEIAPAIRRNCREVWMPVSGDDLEIEAVSSTKGSRVLPANNPDNFRMAWHVWGDYPYRKANLIEGESYRLKQSRLAATTRSAGDFPELHEAVRDALRLGAVSFDAVKHLVLCRVEGRPQRLDLELCWRSFSRPTWKGYPQGGWPDLVKALGCEGISKSQVSRICQELDPGIAEAVNPTFPHINSEGLTVIS